MNDDQTDPLPTPCSRRPAQERGRLKMFLGAAPGVGKTYEMLPQGAAMLRDGRRRRRRRRRNPWPRRDQALLAPFEVMPRRTIAITARISCRNSTSTRCSHGARSSP